jgi:hypothetical protein
MKKANNFGTRFPTQKGVTFLCDMCGKRTRDIDDNGSVGLCPTCYEDCEEENVFSDYGEEAAAEYHKNRKHK